MYNEKKSKKQTNVFVTLTVILMTVAVVVAVAGAVAKNVSEAKKESSDTTEAALREDAAKRRHDTEKEVTEPVTEPVTEAPDTTEPPEESAEDVIAENPLPTFTAPVAGSVMKAHSADVPVFSLTMEDYRTHCGVDISAAIGDDVKAAADGKIQDVWADPMMGTCVSVIHSGNAVTVYKNLSDELPEGIEKGASVSAGDVIASVSDSALEEIAEESHLHFEMTVDGVPADPCDYIVFPEEQVYEG